MTQSKAPADTTVLDVIRRRRDLEKRLKIDITQFEVDNGVTVESIEFHRATEMGHSLPTMVAVTVRVALPK
jgi:hypothetical protein